MDVFIFDAVRTARGKGGKNGALLSIPPAALVGQLVRALDERIGDPVRAAAHLTLGCVTQVGRQGGHIALSSRIQAGLPDEISCLTVNNFCVSGLSAVADAARRIATGQVELALAGGVESMSQVPFLADQADYYADMELARQMGWAPVGLAADLLATREGVDREALDRQVVRSQTRAAAAWDAGRFDGRVVPVRTPDGGLALDRDENIRAVGDGSYLKRLAPVFGGVGAQGYSEILIDRFPELQGIEHLHTLAHCPPVSDGAALLLMGSADAGRRFGLRPLARLRGIGEMAGDHVLQLTAGFAAMDRALQRAGLSLAEVGVVELMEAFAVVPALFEREHEYDPSRVNPNGGHLAMGHPMGATGAILMTTLLDDLTQCDVETGLVVATGGVGVGAAMVIERAA